MGAFKVDIEKDVKKLRGRVKRLEGALEKLKASVKRRLEKARKR